MSEFKQGYKQTKVGIIPEDWEVVRLGELSQNGILNGIFNDPKKVGKGLKLINVVNLYNEPFINYDDLKLLEVSKKEYEKFSALKGDLFFTRSSLKEEGIAHCNLFNFDTSNTVFECHIMRIRPKKEIVDSYYLFRYCQSFYARKRLILNSKTTTMTTIDQNGLYSLLVPLPPLREQKKITEILTTWDDAITKQTELLRAKELQKKGLMQKLLSGEVRFSEFTDKWKIFSLNEVLKERKTYQSKGLELEHVSLTKEGVVPKSERYERDFLVKGEDKQYKITKLNDICYNPANLKFGVICKNTYGNGIFSPIYVTFETKKGFNIDFLGYFLTWSGFINKVRRFEEGTVYERMAVNPKDFLSFKTKLPSLEEQQKIAEVLSLADDEINLLKNELEELKLQKKALMQKLLTGEVRVKV